MDGLSDYAASSQNGRFTINHHVIDALKHITCASTRSGRYVMRSSSYLTQIQSHSDDHDINDGSAYACMETMAAIPTTPSHPRLKTSALGYSSYRPLLSSPLAPTPSHERNEPSSPLADNNITHSTRSHRRGQYKTRTSSGSSRRILLDPATRGAPIPFALTPNSSFHPPSHAESSHAAFFRDRFKAKLRQQHEQRAAARAERRRQAALSDMSSDGFDVSMDADDSGDEEDDDERYFGDELLRRIMLDERRRLAHSYAVSYEMEVGSSFDPNMEDPSHWEEDACTSGFTQPHPAKGLGPPKDTGDYPYLDEDYIEDDFYYDVEFDDDDLLPPSDDNLPPPITTANPNHHYASDDFDADSSWADAYIASLLPNDSPTSKIPSSVYDDDDGDGGDISSSSRNVLVNTQYPQIPHAAAADAATATSGFEQGNGHGTQSGSDEQQHSNQPALISCAGINGRNGDNAEDVTMG